MKGLSTLTTAASATAAATMTSERFLVRASSAACTQSTLSLPIVRRLCKTISLTAITELPSSNRPWTALQHLPSAGNEGIIPRHEDC